MKILEVLFEAVKLNFDDLSSLKNVITSKIKELPDDDATVHALKEIQDLLNHIYSGGKLGIINDKIKQIADPTVSSAQKMLSRYILSIDMTSEQRDELFRLWKTDKLINRTKLLTPGKNRIGDIVTSYDSNPAISEFVNDLMRVSALGQGKGEFGLSVLSKEINKPGKGDLVIDGKKIEVKTTDGGSGRFTDQEVRPAAGFEVAAIDLNTFVMNNKALGIQIPKSGLSYAYVMNNKALGIQIPKSGLSLGQAIKIYESLEGKDKGQFLDKVSKIISLIFGGKSSDSSDINDVVKGIKNVNLGEALQAYSKANFNYYMSMKDDEGVLYIDLNATPISTVFFRNSDDLTRSGVRFHASTVYLTNVNDPRLTYPQITIVVSKAGGAGSNVKTSSDPTIKKNIRSDTSSFVNGPIPTMLNPKLKAPKTPRDKR